jgi:hypothetical protein
MIYVLRVLFCSGTRDGDAFVAVVVLFNLHAFLAPFFPPTRMVFQ